MFIQGVDNVFDITWVDGIRYRDVHHQGEVEHSHYNFTVADTAMLFKLFDMYEQEALRVVEKGLVLPAYDQVLKCSHVFNLLDARGAISVTERTGFVARVRNLARACAQAYVAQREALGYPLLPKEEVGAIDR